MNPDELESRLRILLTEFAKAPFIRVMERYEELQMVLLKMLTISTRNVFPAEIDVASLNCLVDEIVRALKAWNDKPYAETTKMLDCMVSQMNSAEFIVRDAVEWKSPWKDNYELHLDEVFSCRPIFDRSMWDKKLDVRLSVTPRAPAPAEEPSAKRQETEDAL